MKSRTRCPGCRAVRPAAHGLPCREHLLTKKHLEDWRFGRVPPLERVIRGSLSRLSRLLPILGFHCYELNLVASQTAYVKWGKGRRTPLRFTKTSEPRLENIYARHFVWPGKIPFHMPRPKPDASPPKAHDEPNAESLDFVRGHL